MTMTADSPGARERPVTLVAADSYRLGARRHEAIVPGRADSGRGNRGATAFLPAFRRVRERARLRDGLSGLGHARSGSRRRYHKREWLAAVQVGHSFGGHAFGLLPNHERIDRLYTFGTGAGWHGWMSPLEQLRVLAMWRVVGPAIISWKGYLAWSRLGLGEDLPLGVYRQWRRWCRFPQYFLDDPAMAQFTERIGGVRTPIVAANSFDDRRASSRSRDAFMTGYRNTDWQAVDLDHGREGLRGIGHMATVSIRDAARPWKCIYRRNNRPPCFNSHPPTYL